MSTFGFIAAALMPIPYVLYKFGPQIRARSKYTQVMPAGMMKHSRDEETMVRDRQGNDMTNRI